jgi:hypothetical protein
MRHCSKCGKEFEPTHNSQTKCRPDCRIPSTHCDQKKCVECGKLFNDVSRYGRRKICYDPECGRIVHLKRNQDYRRSKYIPARKIYKLKPEKPVVTRELILTEPSGRRQVFIPKKKEVFIFRDEVVNTKPKRVQIRRERTEFLLNAF